MHSSGQNSPLLSRCSASNTDGSLFGPKGTTPEIGHEIGLMSDSTKKNCKNVKKNKRNLHGLWRAANGTRRLRNTTPLAARPVTDCRSDALSHGVRRERRKYRGRGVTSRRPEPSSSAVLNLFHKSVGSVFVFLHAACILQRNCDSTNMYMYIDECM